MFLFPFSEDSYNHNAPETDLDICNSNAVPLDLSLQVYPLDNQRPAETSKAQDYIQGSSVTCATKTNTLQEINQTGNSFPEGSIPCTPEGYPAQCYKPYCSLPQPEHTEESSTYFNNWYDSKQAQTYKQNPLNKVSWSEMINSQSASREDVAMATLHSQSVSREDVSMATSGDWMDIEHFQKKTFLKKLRSGLFNQNSSLPHLYKAVKTEGNHGNTEGNHGHSRIPSCYNIDGNKEIKGVKDLSREDTPGHTDSALPYPQHMIDYGRGVTIPVARENSPDDSHSVHGIYYSLFQKKRNFSPWIFPGAQGQGHVTWGHCQNDA